jgi:hypothetical protein
VSTTWAVLLSFVRDEARRIAIGYNSLRDPNAADRDDQIVHLLPS